MVDYEPGLARLAVPCEGVTVRYGEEPDQFGQLWPASGAGPHPVAVLVHGGYWRAGYRLDLMNAMAAHLSATGVAVWNLEYRRVGSPGGGRPGTFDDVEAGFAMLPRLAGEYGLDLGRVAVIGHSAGGQLALWLLARMNRAPDPPVRPAFTVALAPVSDLVEAHRRRLSRDAAAELLGARYADAPERYRAASPAALLPLGGRYLIVHGSADEAVPYDMSVGFHTAARAAGDDCELLTLPGGGHFEPIDPDTAEWRRISRYITRAIG